MTTPTFFGWVCVALGAVSAFWGLPIKSKTERPSTRDAVIYYLLAYIFFHWGPR